jgi:pilus assembly protein Flp/PilA
MKTILKMLFRDEAGATAVEYGLILALIVLAMLAALQNFADGSITMWDSVSSKTADAIAGAAS